MYQQYFKRHVSRLMRQVFKSSVAGRTKMLSSLPEQSVCRFGNAETVELKTPSITVQEMPEVLASYVGQHLVEQPFVCDVSEAILAGQHAVGISKQGVLMETVVGRWYLLEQSQFPQTLLHPIQKTEAVVNIACSLTNAWSRNYFHWITECLTRLEGLEFFYNQMPSGAKPPKLIINKDPAPWQQESLQLLGYSSRDWIEWDYSKMYVKHLIVPSTRRYQERSRASEVVADIMSPAARQWLQDRLFYSLGINRQQTTPCKRIFVSRRKAPARKILNELEVMDFLEPLGFQAYILEDLSFSEQVRLFSQADVVIAPHGAGLTNILFCQSAKVIELFGHPHYIRPDYFQLAQCADLQYTFLICDYQEFDLSVDIQQLSNLLDRLEVTKFCASKFDQSLEIIRSQS